MAWEYNQGRWQRDDLRADLVSDGIDAPRKHAFSAPSETARELSYLASVEAVQQAMGKTPEPRNPFVQSASDSDAYSLRPRDWAYQPDSGKWTREVVTALDHRELQSKAEYHHAKPERAAQLSAQAMQMIDNNVAQGPALIAAQYQIAHQRNGWNSFGGEPAAVSTALNPELLQTSDGKHYQRDAQGQWMHEGVAASPHRALELELTHERLQPALQQHAQSLAQMPAWQALTQEQLDRESLSRLYADNHVVPSSERFEAAYAAVLQTREQHGLSPANSSLALTKDMNGHFTTDSAIQHLQYDSASVVRVAATTTREDIVAMHNARNPESNRDSPSAVPVFNPAAPQSDSPSPLSAPLPASQSIPKPGANNNETPEVETLKKTSQLRHPGSAEHPFHSLYSQATAFVNKEDERLGRTPDEKSERLALAATALAADSRMTRIDHMLFSVEDKARGLKAGENVIVVQGGLNDPAHDRAHMKTEVAINMPAEQSLKQMDVIHRQQTEQAQVMAMQRTQANDQNSPVQRIA